MQVLDGKRILSCQKSDIVIKLDYCSCDDYNTPVENHILESTFPLSFREDDAKILGEKIRTRQSIVMVGIKRVGISSFLRFFLTHPDIKQTYIKDTKKHIFISVDLNDMVEIELFPFWVLMLKRIVDVVERIDLDEKAKKEVRLLFLDCIQTQDLFLTIDSVRKILIILCDAQYLPTLFLLRFDRMQNAVTPELFANLQGLLQAMHNRISFIFTSVRELESLAPQVFRKATVSAYIETMYIKPCKHEDVTILLDAHCRRLALKITPLLEKALVEYVDGYSQYLQFALVFMNENRNFISDKKALFDLLVQDERVVLQSEEIWESLTESEKGILLRIGKKDEILEQEKKAATYLWDSGILDKKNTIFSPLFAFYLTEKNKENQRKGNKIEYTKKEYLLLNLLEQHEDEVCERELIIEMVWPEVEGLGVSDWAIDRLVARVRSKLKKQKSKVRIVTVKTRGYKLIKS